MLDFIFDFFMHLFPEWLSHTILGSFIDRVGHRIKNRLLRGLIYLIVFLIAIAIALGLAIVILVLTVWMLMKLKIITE